MKKARWVLFVIQWSLKELLLQKCRLLCGMLRASLLSLSSQGWGPCWANEEGSNSLSYEARLKNSISSQPTSSRKLYYDVSNVSLKVRPQTITLFQRSFARRNFKLSRRHFSKGAQIVNTTVMHSPSKLFHFGIAFQQKYARQPHLQCSYSNWIKFILLFFTTYFNVLQPILTFCMLKPFVIGVAVNYLIT